MAEAKVNRDLKLTEPLTEGPDVEALQHHLNEIADKFDQIVHYNLDQDRTLGRRTFNATRRAAFVMGLAQPRLDEIAKKRLIAQAVQLKLRQPDERDSDEKSRAEERRKECREQLDKGEPECNGHPDNVTDLIKEVIVAANKAGLFVTATTDGTHTATSFHYPQNNADGLGHAVDVAGGFDQMVAFQKEAVKRFPQALEIYGPANFPWIRAGQVFTEADGTALENQHDTHVHVAR